MNQMDEEILQDFIAESRDMLDEVEPQLIELETSGGGPTEAAIGAIFRLFHSIKGSAGFLNLSVISGVTHHAETLLDLFRKGKAEVGTHHTDLMCRCCDLIRAILVTVETEHNEEPHVEDGQALEEELRQAITEAKGQSADAPAGKTHIEETTDNDSRPPASPHSDLAVSTEAAIDLDGSQDMVHQFVEDASEALNAVGERLLDLERDPADADTQAEILRSIHSFKGNCGILGYADLERLTHRVEEVVQGFKDGSIPPAEEAVPVLISVVDVMKSSVEGLSSGGDGSVPNGEMLLEFLSEALPNPAVDDGQVASVEPPEPDQAPVGDPRQPREADGATSETTGSHPVEPAAGRPDEPVDQPGSAPIGSVPQSLERRQGKRRDIRVDLDKLDTLIDLVGELVIAESLVTRNPDLEGHELENFEKAAIHLNKLIRDLQEVAMSVRMIPISGLFRKMIRLVRDLSIKTGKKVELQLVGEETEVDKTVAELLADPLVHILRNAVDHGIESAEKRGDAGKPITGLIRLEATHEGGEVLIKIQDDGAGIDRERILAKARERGLVNGDGSSLGDGEVFQLIFEPGFSTADEITDVSGRGVGMDVVKKNIEQLKGQIEVSSKPGRGSTFALRIPLTLAVIDGMLVRVGESTYTIPIQSICQSLKPRREEVTVNTDGQEVVNIRGDLVPIVRLHELHGRTPDSYDLADGLLVVVEAHGERFCLFVDELMGQQQTVIKGLNSYLGNVRGVSGCAVLGNGDVSLIVDLVTLVELARTQGEQDTFSRAGCRTGSDSDATGQSPAAAGAETCALP